MTRRLFVSAGEASGDRHLDALLGRLEERTGRLELAGLGGDRVAARGARLLAHADDLSVMGFSDVARRLPFFVGLYRRAVREMERTRPDLVLLVDYPGLNLRIGRAARARGIRVVWYIAPQVWAWRRERRPGIRAAVDRLLVVFPFEEPLFREAGIDATFVGHPLLDDPEPAPPRDALRRELGIGAGEPLLALLPGSRAGEVGLILPVLVAAARRLAGRGVRAVVSRRSGLPGSLFSVAIRENILLWDGGAAALTRAADAALVASGTATLETGLGGTPLAVVYRTGRLNWLLARRLVSIRTVGLVNIAAGGARVPELLQDDFTAERAAGVAGRLLFDETERAEQRAYLAPLSARLGGSGSAGRAAACVAGLLEEAAPGAR